MKHLIENDFPLHYGIGRSRSCTVCDTDSNAFDLIDAPECFIVPFGNGDVSFINSGANIQVLGYERFLNQFSGTSLSDGRKRCDFIMYDLNGNAFILLCEITSATNTVENLAKPITDGKGNVVYSGGKYEKAELQLFDTLANIIPVPKIADYVHSKNRKVCLMSYVLRYGKNQPAAQNAFNRARLMEAKEAGEAGAQISSPQIESFGFSFYRICHDYSFVLTSN